MPSSTSVRAERLSSTLVKVFQGWRDLCLNSPHDSREALRSESKDFFSSLFQTTEVLTADNVVLRTRASHSEALAQLIQELGPAFSNSSLTSRICAIYCLDGAVEGSSESGLSYNVLNLLGKFLLGHCGPIEDDELDDADELVRDAAITCLAALVRCKVPDASGDGCSIEEIITQRAILAKQGVECRGAVSALEHTEYSHGYDMPSQSGLSTLPRSRRSLCFALLKACIDGIKTDTCSVTTALSQDALTVLVSFSEFVPSCLHGESDPRCLLQLLRVLRSLLKTMLVLFQNKESMYKFPLLSVFDAVAPYYPIQFEPPPNDVHGITREGLSSALMDVLCFTGYDSFVEGQETMLNLSTGIFLGCLLPLDNEDESLPSTVEDKIGAIHDLTGLLFPPGQPLVCQLSDEATRELSNGLIAAHAEGAAGVAEGGDDGKRHKVLADSCRSLVSRLAAAFESCSRKTLWDAFVKVTVDSLSPLLSTSPQSMQGRTATAYLACLAASGGSRTLGYCLGKCMPPLLDLLSGESDDVEKTTAGIFAIGAFFSSLEAAAETNDGSIIVLHPHPLGPYSSIVAKALCDFAYPTDAEEQSYTLRRVSAIRALDTVLTVTPASLLTEGDIDDICRFVEMLSSLVRVDVNSMETDPPCDTEVQKACSRTLGSLLACSFQETTSSNAFPSSVVQGNEKIRQYFQQNLCPALVSSSTHASQTNQCSSRFDWVTLASACETRHDVSKHIVPALANSLLASIKQNGEDNSEGFENARACAAALGLVLQRGGTSAAGIFHNLTKPDASSLDIINALLPLNANVVESRSGGGALKSSVSNLKLPATSEELTKMKGKAKGASEILSLLQSAYEYPLPVSTLQDMLNFVTHVLPPLSDLQNVQLGLVLPLFSAALSAGVAEPDAEPAKLASLRGGLFTVAPVLIDYALTGDDAKARSAAAESIFSLIVKFPGISVGAEPLELVAMRDTILPLLSAALKELDSNERASFVMVQDSLNLAALVGTAAACRGGPSANIADQTTRFLVQLACSGKATLPLSNNDTIIDLQRFDFKTQTALHIASATAFGSMIGTEGGSPFWRQRLIHLATGELVSSTSRQESSSGRTLGQLVVASYIVASSQIQTMSETTISNVSEIVVRGFVMSYSDPARMSETSTVGPELTVAAVVKLLIVAPSTVFRFSPAVISCLLQSFVLCGSELGKVSLALLVLQGILAMAHCPEETRKAQKSNVIRVVSTGIDHPSSVIRSATVDVINAWSIVT